jgi:hypothetical protein
MLHKNIYQIKSVDKINETYILGSTLIASVAFKKFDNSLIGALRTVGGSLIVN